MMEEDEHANARELRIYGAGELQTVSCQPTKFVCNSYRQLFYQSQSLIHFIPELYPMKTQEMSAC